MRTMPSATKTIRRHAACPRRRRGCAAERSGAHGGPTFDACGCTQLTSGSTRERSADSAGVWGLFYNVGASRGDDLIDGDPRGLHRPRGRPRGGRGRSAGQGHLRPSNGAMGTQPHRSAADATGAVPTVARELSLDASTNERSWRAVRGHGVVNVDEIEGVGRSSPPGVYACCSTGGARTACWSSRRGAAVASLFAALREMNPRSDTSGIYGSSTLWWKGLPAP